MPGGTNPTARRETCPRQCKRDACGTPAVTAGAAPGRPNHLPASRVTYMLVAYMAPDIFGELKKGSAETLILALLDEEPRHGYDLARLIDDRTRGRLSFHVANVYTSLYRLERAGFIVGRWVEKAGQRRRRFYRLTRSGRKELVTRRESWREFVGAVDIVLGPA
jgi:PadR family transcriptional regulator PadR